MMLSLAHGSVMGFDGRLEKATMGVESRKTCSWLWSTSEA